MSSGGHIADMIVRMENNRALLKHHRRYKDIIELYANQSLKKPLEWKSLDDHERSLLIAHLHDVLKINRRNTIKAIVLSAFITLGLIALMIVLFRWVFL